MRIDVLTLFPAMFGGPFDESIVARARAAGLLDLRIHNLRDWSTDRHRTVDDYPYGGGAGMVLKPEPVVAAVESLRGAVAERGGHVVLLTPQGEVFRQQTAATLAGRGHLVLVCGHYEGIDERIREHAVDQEVSIGDYVLSGGELPAMVLVDAVVRLLPGALGSPLSAVDEFAQRRTAGVPPVHPPGRVPGLARPGRAPLRAPRRDRPLAPRAGPPAHARAPPGPPPPAHRRPAPRRHPAPPG